jgi:integrase
MEIVGRNVCAAVDPPAQEQSKATALTEKQIPEIVAAAAGSRWEHFVGAALMLGTRRGELLALSWNDVDLEAGTVTIRASISQTKAAVTMKSTKSGKIRVVPLSQAARAVFRRQKALQAADKLKKGEHYRNADEAVFTDEGTGSVRRRRRMRSPESLNEPASLLRVFIVRDIPRRHR